MFTTYLLYSPDYDKIYIGFTSDIEQRLLSHNIFAKKGWTITFRPWILVYSEIFNTKAEAMKREKQLKSAKGREFARIKVAEYNSEKQNKNRAVANSSGSYPPVGGRRNCPRYYKASFLEAFFILLCLPHTSGQSLLKELTECSSLIISR